MTRERLNDIAVKYHLVDDVPDMFIENICQECTLEWITARLAPPGVVLELGHGNGIVTAALLEQGHQLHVVEGAEPLVAQLRAHFADRLTVHAALFEEFEPRRRFDYIVASHVLEHVDDPVFLLRRLRGWLEPGGKFLVIVPNRESIHRQLAVRMGLQPRLDSLGPRDELVGHQRVYSFDTLRADLAAGGFRVDEEKGFFLKVLPNSMMLQFSPQLIRALNDVAELLPGCLLANIAVLASPCS